MLERTYWAAAHSSSSPTEFFNASHLFHKAGQRRQGMIAETHGAQAYHSSKKLIGIYLQTPCIEFIFHPLMRDGQPGALQVMECLKTTPSSFHLMSKRSKLVSALVLAQHGASQGRSASTRAVDFALISYSDYAHPFTSSETNTTSLELKQGQKHLQCLYFCFLLVPPQQGYFLSQIYYYFFLISPVAELVNSVAIRCLISKAAILQPAT